MLDKLTTIRRLTNRWNEQVEKFPRMRDDVPLALYIERNFKGVRDNELFADYDQAERAR